MTTLSRRSLLQVLLTATATSAVAQTNAAPAPTRSASRMWCAAPASSPPCPIEDAAPPLPEPLNQLDFDAYRDIRFRPDRALLGSAGGPFRMQLFHLGFLFRRPITVNVIRDGVPTPVPYQGELFDYGKTRIERPLPVNLGFAGFRLHFPLNDPRTLDELIVFLGASYFRFLGRGHKRALGARPRDRCAAAPRAGRVSLLPRVLDRASARAPTGR